MLCADGCACDRRVPLPDTLDARTAKIVVAGADVYATVARHAGQVAYVDVTLSVRGGLGSESERAVDLEQTKGDAARAMVELICREANALLAAGVWTEADLISAWAATRFDPAGVTVWPGGQYGIASSPMDAVARWLSAQRTTLDNAAEVA